MARGLFINYDLNVCWSRLIGTFYLRALSNQFSFILFFSPPTPHPILFRIIVLRSDFTVSFGVNPNLKRRIDGDIFLTKSNIDTL